MAEPFTIYKLMVLYMADNAKKALTNSQISEFILDHDYTDYFQLQKVLSELTETGLLSRKVFSSSSYYEITDEGKKVLPYFERDLSKDIQEEIREYLKKLGYDVAEPYRMPADYFETPQGGYAVRCQILENGSSILDLTMAAPNLEAARAICELWPYKSHDIYGMIMGELV